jgi:quinol monooxygenase YgiN
MSEPVVRVSQGFFEPQKYDIVATKLKEGRANLEPALRALPGLIHYYVSIDSTSNSMVNVSIWESLQAAQQMNTLKEMLAQRDIFVAQGVQFQPIRNYSGLWSINP